jgi:hypothetical protein
MMGCIYCRENKSFTDEHVLTRAFAGQGENWTLVDTVCGDCNAAFSICERVWTSSPGEALARIYHGPAGRKRKGHSYRVHPAEHVYMIQEDDPIAYEAEILNGLEPRLRPQLIWTGNELIAVASDMKEGQRLQVSYAAFMQHLELTVYKSPNATKIKRFLIAKLGSINGGKFPSVVGYEWRDRPTLAWLDSFPARPSREPFHCRASVDQDDYLRIRAENVETALAFLQSIQNEHSVRSGSKAFTPGYKIHIEHLHDQIKMNRAIAKTAFNLAIRLLGKDTMSQPSFDRCRAYCWSGEGDDPQHPFVGYIVEARYIARLPSLLSARNESQHVFLLTSNGQRLICLIRLYGGPVLRVHLGKTDLQAFEKYVAVDYGGSGTRLL